MVATWNRDSYGLSVSDFRLTGCGIRAETFVQKFTDFLNLNSIWNVIEHQGNFVICVFYSAVVP